MWALVGFAVAHGLSFWMFSVFLRCALIACVTKADCLKVEPTEEGIACVGV